MEKPSELVGFKREDTKLRFFNLCNDIGAANLFLHDKEKILHLKDEFYRNFDDFLAEGFDPVGEITLENLKKFEEYRNIIWTADVVKELLSYIKELR
jgi:hypothetical protein